MSQTTTDAAGNADGQLLKACMRGDAVAARRALDDGADPSRKLVEGMSPLLLAARIGSAPLIEILFERGDPVPRGSLDGRVAWVHAAARRHDDACRALERYGCRGSLLDRLILVRLLRRRIAAAEGRDAAASGDTDPAPAPGDVPSVGAAERASAAAPPAPASSPAPASAPEPAAAATADAPPDATERQDPAALCEQFATIFVDTMREVSPEMLDDFDRSESSIARMDAAITELWGGSPPTMVQQMVMTWGGYLACTIAACTDGRIDSEGEAIVVRVPGVDGDVTLSPFTWVHKRFVNGEEDLLAFKYQVMKQMAAGELDAG